MYADSTVTFTRRARFESALVRMSEVTAQPHSERAGAFHTLDHHAIVLPLRGLFTTHFSSRQEILGTPSDAILLGAGVSHRYSFPGRIGDQCLVLRFSAESLARAYPQALEADAFSPRRSRPWTLLPPEALVERAMLWQHVRDGDADPLASEECAVRLLRGVVQAARGDSAPHGERGRAARIRRRHRVARAKEAIVREPARRWSLSELADCASMSPYHLAHVFRDEVGTSVFDYVIRTRLVHALEKVLDSDCDLTSVALEAGFASHSHFTARFRALFGRTPSELRHSLKRSLADELRKIRAVS